VSELFKGMIKRRHPGFGAGLGTVEPAKAPDGALNVVYIVLDDVGFSANGRRGVHRPQPLFPEILPTETSNAETGTPSRPENQPHQQGSAARTIRGSKPRHSQRRHFRLQTKYPYRHGGII
jgi:hypothetical protein